jgi:ppGpp synthetase/RelA/SpoT-type nucleotidyltranferase
MTVDVAPRRAEILSWYTQEIWRRRAFEEKLTDKVKEVIAGANLGKPTIESRTKTVDSFLAKAVKVDPVDENQFKYADPRTEITDVVGIRIVVSLSTDVSPVRAVLHEAFSVVEELERGGEGTVDVPGYQSVHLLVRLADADKGQATYQAFADLVAEIQVRTTLQHAWASLQHDMMYKADHTPTPAVRRRLTALAGLLELADREFTQVRRDHSDPTVAIASTAPQGSPGAVNAASLRLLAEELMGQTDVVDQAWFLQVAATVEQLGLGSIDDVRAALGAWGDRAIEVQAAVLVRKPFANPARVLDELLRLSLGPVYFDRRVAVEAPSDLPGARAHYETDRGELLRSLPLGS